MLVGAHVSVAGGLVKALDYAESVGAECCQFFAKSPRQWRGPTADPEVAAAFVAAREERGFGPVFTHTAYLINLSTTDDELRVKSVTALADELVRASLLGASGVVTHIGNDPGSDIAAAARRAAESVVVAFQLAGEAASGVRLLLENTAGAGSSFGCTVAELATTIDLAGMPPEQLGVCIDTCHAFAHGLALETEEGWESLASDLSQTLGLDRVGLIHANDCLFERGSKRDRHAWIGEGYIGEAGFSAMLCSEAFDHVPCVTEMPGEVPVKDEVNLGRLKELRSRCGASQ